MPLLSVQTVNLINVWTDIFNFNCMCWKMGLVQRVHHCQHRHNELKDMFVSIMSCSVLCYCKCKLLNDKECLTCSTFCVNVDSWTACIYFGPLISMGCPHKYQTQWSISLTCQFASCMSIGRHHLHHGEQWSWVNNFPKNLPLCFGVMRSCESPVCKQNLNLVYLLKGNTSEGTVFSQYCAEVVSQLIVNLDASVKHKTEHHRPTSRFSSINFNGETHWETVQGINDTSALL